MPTVPKTIRSASPGLRATVLGSGANALALGTVESTAPYYELRSPNTLGGIVGSPFGMGVVIDTCEEGWTNVANATVTHSSTHFTEGTKAVKIVNTSAGSASVSAQKNITAIDLTNAISIEFDVYVEGPATGSGNTPDNTIMDTSFKIFLTDTTGGAGNGKSYQQNMLARAGWNRVTIPISAMTNVGTGAVTGITYVLFQAVTYAAGSYGGAGSLVLYVDNIRANVMHKPVVIPWFDDNWAEAYSAAFPVMQQYGVTGTMACIQNTVDGGGYCTTAQLQAMYNAGWDMVNHTATHIHFLTDIGPSDGPWKMITFTGAANTTTKFTITLQGPSGSATTAAIDYSTTNYTLIQNIVAAIAAITGSTGLTCTAYIASIGSATSAFVVHIQFLAAGVATQPIAFSATLTAGAGSLVAQQAYQVADILSEYQTCKNFLTANNWTRYNCHMFVAYPYGQGQVFDNGGNTIIDLRIMSMHSTLGNLAARGIDGFTGTGLLATNPHGGKFRRGQFGMATVYAGSTDGNRLYAATVMASVQRAMSNGAGVIPIMFHRVLADGSSLDVYGTKIHLTDFTQVIKELAAMRDAGLIDIKTVGQWYSGLNLPT